MKAAMWTAPGHLEFQDLPVPELRTGEVLIRVHAVGVCGTDLHIWRGAIPDRVPPLILGHEMSGEVVEVKDVDTVKRGDPVVVYPLLGCGICMHCLQGRDVLCRHRKARGIFVCGGFAEYLRAPGNNVFRLTGGKNGTSGPALYKLGALVEPLGAVLRSVMAAAGDVGPAAVLGLGPIGIMILQVAKLRGFSKIAALDINPNRMAVAKKLGADLVLSPAEPNVLDQLNDFFGEDGCRVVWNAAGVSPARALAQKIARSGGLMMEVGMADDETTIDFLDLMRREVRIIPSHGYSREQFAAAASLLEEGRLNTTDWVEEEPIETIQSVFEDLDRRDTSRVKVIFQAFR
jgi:2-desacetyl-2-hydroxyethyl bacteriochlorophyllide A dehydrogenase